MIKISINKSIKLGITYSFFVLIMSTIITLFMSHYGENYQEFANVLKLILVLFSFLPLLIFKDNDDYKLEELGFKFSWRSVIITFCIVLLLGLSTGFQTASELTFGTKIIEGVARTGEEFFFRGFIYLIILKIFKDEKHKNASSMIFSSLIFTIAHTEIFLGTYHFGFVNMFFNTFITFAMIRHFSKSLLPVVAIHTFMNGGIVSCIFGIMITSVIIYINHTREKFSVEGYRCSN
ncbi:MAG: CPBP family intramembrane metalloprotease [Clostridiales bacterium]|nr:CPBP family intramembrane metalloprotease [Clostridiales bacterium]